MLKKLKVKPSMQIYAVIVFCIIVASFGSKLAKISTFVGTR